MRIDFRRRQTTDVGKRDFHSFHGEDVEAGFLKVARKHIVDAAGKISDADESFHAEPTQRFDLSLSRSDDGNFKFGFPFFDDLFFAFESVHHKRRRAFRVNQIDAFLGQFFDLLMHGVERAAKLVFGAALKIQINRHDADPLG